MENKKEVFYPFDVLLPKKEYDYHKWAVIACDQYTSDMGYWTAVAEEVGAEPSTLKMIVPEAYLNDADVDKRIDSANKAMQEYLDGDIFDEYKNSMVYVERQQSNGKLRKGLIGTIDLTEYDYKNSAGCLVRPTEDVVLSRIPPRLKVRENALLETSHVLLLIADKDNKVIGSLEKKKDSMPRLYDFELQQGSGHICGYQIKDADVNDVQRDLESLIKEELLFLVGDGNHSVATAKEAYGMNTANELARYTVVEVINLFDESLIFEPIHRIVYNTDVEKMLAELKAFYPGTVEGEGEGHRFELCTGGRSFTVTVPYEHNPLAVGALQTFLDRYLSENEGKIDYIHSPDEVRMWGKDEKNMGFVLPEIDIDGLFNYVKEKGRLPRKTFSIGNQEDKKFYLECRKIK